MEDRLVSLFLVILLSGLTGGFIFTMSYQSHVSKMIVIDVDKNSEVNILDVALVARVLDSGPGDLNWNEAADLNNDDVVNIVEISMIAKNFGARV